MAKTSTYEKLKQRIQDGVLRLTGHKRSEGLICGSAPEPKPILESSASLKNQIQISVIELKWDTNQGLCTFENLPVAMMWIDTTLAGFMSGVQAMVGTERFGLALQSEGRKSVEADWDVISRFEDFGKGFRAIANIAAVAGWATGN